VVVARTWVWIVAGVAGALGLGVGGLALAAMGQPDVIRVERSRTMKAAPEDILPHVSDLKAFVGWSPWSGRDPQQVVTFSDPPGGVGAWYTWRGNADVGAGKMTVTAVEPDRVEHRLEFEEPMTAKAQVTLRAVSEGEESRVTWGFEQPADFGTKVAGLFMSFDTLLGQDFEQGLNNLATVAEPAAVARKQAEAKALEEMQRLVEEEAARLAPAGAPADGPVAR
jgi:hypothetical protein